MFSLKTRRLLRWLLPAAALLTAAAVLAALFFTGVLKLNTPSRERYPVRGVDVSSWQGEIDWPTLAGQGLSFAFIKATEGSGFTDPRFSYNWEEARKTALRVGAYHFFSYDSPGETQADNFIAAVPREPGALPPVVDVEFYGDKAADPPAAADVHPQLDALLRRLEAHYGVRPILYATGKAYRLYLECRYDDYDLWIRDVYFTPSLPASRPWTFWQYADNARLQGYTGREPCIDMNVFSGTPEEFAAYVGVPA